MIVKIDSIELKGSGPFKILFPGIKLNQGDTGIASIGRIDHSFFEGDTLIPMHPHINDEIITYMRSGNLEHLDSEGYSKKLDSKTWILMKAGHLFHHEEKIVDKGEPLEALQIFIRPGKKDLQPEVKFFELDNLYSINKWRIIASPNSENGFKFSSNTWIFDVRLSETFSIDLPIDINKDLTALLYVFNGNISVNNKFTLRKKDSIIIENEKIEIKCNEISDLVLFITDKSKPYFDGGMFSRNRTK